VRKLESLQAWTCGREIARTAYRLTLNPPLSRHFSLADQIRRAAAAIPANIAEGYALGTTAQFIRFLRIALGSATELRTHLELVRDLGLAAAEAVENRSSSPTGLWAY
jgi:four helix bundle protein